MIICTFAVFNTIFYSDQITLTVSHSLPMLQENETYFCHFAEDEETFMVPAVGSGATYTCNITGSLPAEYGGLATGLWTSKLLSINLLNLSLSLFSVLNVSFVSSLRGIPFSTNVGGFTIYICSATSRYVG